MWDSDRILGNWLELGLSLDFAAMWTVNQQVDFVYLSPTPGFLVNNKFIQKKKDNLENNQHDNI